jgi:hypothetical protein
MSFTLSIPSPRLLVPRVQLSPVRQRVSPVRRIHSPRRQTSIVRKTRSPRRPIYNSKTRAIYYKTNKQKFHTNPHINPETNRKIKQGGKTYQRLVTIYGMP